MKIKLLQELNPSQKTLKAISSTHPTKIKITSGKINVLEPTNIETIIPIRYLLFYEAKIIEFYEYPEDRIKENNFINHQTKQTFNKNELIIYMTENPENIIKPKIDTNKDFENIEKAIQKLKQQEEKLVELYLSSSLDPETKKLILHKFIRQIEISRDEEYFIDISNIKFEKQYFNKNARIIMAFFYQDKKRVPTHTFYLYKIYVHYGTKLILHLQN